ncbi:hypothetical protein BIY24_01845 [Halobacteriovorax marinus]|uniref:hypothetical protein n=1 Tax=Halobacteriovorax marinus TaxID=97084 RepID=UPI000BC35AB0|nr:hypothetical protein [Halobacteriovorax marinus]ATH06723.1 hypothetical protein BIY24_01845 [Halobacteriovorax marinus]
MKRANLTITAIATTALFLFVAFFFLNAQTTTISVLSVAPLLSLTIYSFYTLSPATTAFFALSLLSIGINSIHAHLTHHNFHAIGWAAIHDYNFTISSFLHNMTSYFLLIVTIFLISLLFRERIKDERYYQLKIYIPKFKNSSSRDNSRRIYIYCSLSILMSICMHWFYIGMIGISPETNYVLILPFKLNGILYYTRLYVFPAILTLCILTGETNHRKTAILLITNSLIAGIASTSRLCFFLNYIPFFIFVIKNYSSKVQAVALITFILGDNLVAINKELTYKYAVWGVPVPIYQHFYYSLKESIFREGGFFTQILSSTGRLGLFQSIVLSNLQGNIHYPDALKKIFLGKEIISDATNFFYFFSPPIGQNANIGFIGRTLFASQGEPIKVLTSAVFVTGLLKFIDITLSIIQRTTMYTLNKVQLTLISFVFTVLCFENRKVQLLGVVSIFLIAALIKKVLNNEIQK